jgi:sigma-B regulation protein RsbU (phosphoserine phosphatase)
MTSKTLLQTLAQTGMSPAEVLTEANAKLCASNEAGMFVTVWMGALEISTGRFVYANAGHNAPLLSRSGGAFEFLKARPGFVLAGMEGVRYRQQETTLQPGDLLYLYTDGVTEAADPADRLYGEERLKETLDRSGPGDLKALLHGVKADIEAFASGAEQSDRRGQGMKQLRVAARRDRLDDVLAFIEEELLAAGCPAKARMQWALAAEEVFVNIADYAYGSGSGEAIVSMDISGNPPVATVVFSDGGAPHDPLEKPDPDVTMPAADREIGGLGIFLIKKSVDEVRYRREDGKNVLTLTKALG